MRFAEIRTALFVFFECIWKVAFKRKKLFATIKAKLAAIHEFF